MNRESTRSKRLSEEELDELAITEAADDGAREAPVKVLGFDRSAVPVVTDLEEAARWPELGVLSAMAHGKSEKGATIAFAVLSAIRGLDDDRARVYFDLVFNALNETARRTLEAMPKGNEILSHFAQKYVAQGRAERLAQGRAEEAARNLLAVLRVRGLTVPDAARDRILAEKDPEGLERWLEKAAVAATVAEVIDEPN